MTGNDDLLPFDDEDIMLAGGGFGFHRKQELLRLERKRIAERLREIRNTFGDGHTEEEIAKWIELGAQ